MGFEGVQIPHRFPWVRFCNSPLLSLKSIFCLESWILNKAYKQFLNGGAGFKKLLFSTIIYLSSIYLSASTLINVPENLSLKSLPCIFLSLRNINVAHVYMHAHTLWKLVEKKMKLNILKWIEHYFFLFSSCDPVIAVWLFILVFPFQLINEETLAGSHDP